MNRRAHMGSVMQDNAELIGIDAARQVQRGQVWRLGMICSGIVAVALTVGAQSTGSAALTGVAVLAWLAFAGTAATSLAAIRRAKTLASQHLSSVLGFPVRRAAFSTPQGWRSFIERERQYHEQGYRPKFSITIGNPPGRRR